MDSGGREPEECKAFVSLLQEFSDKTATTLKCIMLVAYPTQSVMLDSSACIGGVFLRTG